MTVIAYLGQAGGADEYHAVQGELSRLPPSEWLCGEHFSLNRTQAPRLLYAVRRLSHDSSNKQI